MPSSIKIRGIAPPDVPGLPSAMRRQFWALVAPIALRVKDQELAAGLDANGQPLKPISPRTRRYRKSAMVPGGKGDPSAPPLMPARQKSRTRALLAARVVGDTHVELYWRFDPFTGDQWSRILTFQREQGRDVFGISPDGMKKIRQQSAAAWTKWKKLNAEPEKYLPAFMSHAIRSGQPQSRIAVTIAQSALPGAGSRAGVPVVGTTVRQTMTRGIGAPKRAELAVGQYSGGKTAAGWQAHFTQEVTLGRGGGAVVVTRPKPRPELPRAARAAMGPAAKPGAKATIERNLGVRFVPSSVAQGNPEYTTVVIDVAKVDADLRRSPDSYVGSEGSGAAIAGRYAEFVRFLVRAKAEGIAIEQPRAYIAADDGLIGLGDGRHRFAVLRDQGARYLPVSVRKEDAAAIRARYGA